MILRSAGKAVLTPEHITRHVLCWIKYVSLALKAPGYDPRCLKAGTGQVSGRPPNLGPGETGLPQFE